MFEFSLTLGPLHIAFRLANPEPDTGEYVELTTDTVLADEDQYEEPAEEDRIGFRGVQS